MTEQGNSWSLGCAVKHSKQAPLGMSGMISSVKLLPDTAIFYIHHQAPYHSVSWIVDRYTLEKQYRHRRALLYYIQSYR